jgi:hypothetical protein
LTVGTIRVYAPSMTTTTAPKFSSTQALAFHQATGYWPAQLDGLRRVFVGKGKDRNLLASVYDGEAQDMDTEAGRWQTVCERHSTIISHDTLELANHHLTDVRSWCEGCQPTNASEGN